MRMVWRMGDDKPNPFDDLRKGLGLLFRAARTTVEKLPKTDLEEVVVTSAREVGRAIESVGRAIEREVFGKKEGRPDASARDGRNDERGASDSAKTPDRDSDSPKPGDSTPPNAA
jgi:hypothetical protein